MNVPARIIGVESSLSSPDSVRSSPVDRSVDNSPSSFQPLPVRKDVADYSHTPDTDSGCDSDRAERQH